ncbi:MAG TPA: sialidase family protein [Thermoanaerobaculia bacterium]|jgi:hypothetical protein|nr:sialidase family protein [Thermoanaerobaculia bacterium]
MKKVALPLALLSLFTVFAAWALAQRTPEPERFSLERWKKQQEAWGAVFEGDVLPGGRPRVRTPIDLKTLAPPARAAAPASTRISFDILEANGGAAQPETQAEPHLALNPGRETNLLAGYQEGRFEDGGARALTYSVSFDAGRTWEEGLLPGLTIASGGPFERASDPWVAFGPGNRAYYVSLGFNQTRLENGIFVSVSEDGGRTWGPPVAVHTTSTGFDDKEAIVVDNRADSPFRGRVYVGWDSITADRRQVELISYSTDGGLSYRPPVTIHDRGANIGIIPLVGPGGVVYAVWARFNTGRGPDGFSSIDLLVSRSTDGGDTWSEPVVINNVLSHGVETARTGASIPTAAIDPKKGDLYVAWQDSRFSSFRADQIVLSSSTDGGQTWSAPKRISDGPLDAPAFTPALAVNANGTVGVSYYSLRNDPSRRFLVDEYFTFSKNRGRSFRTQRVSATSWDLRFAAYAEGFFLGDYQGLVAGKQAFYPLWIATLTPSRIDPPALQPDAFTRAVKVR